MNIENKLRISVWLLIAGGVIFYFYKAGVLGIAFMVFGYGILGVIGLVLMFVAWSWLIGDLNFMENDDERK